MRLRRTYKDELDKPEIVDFDQEWGRVLWTYWTDKGELQEYAKEAGRFVTRAAIYEVVAEAGGGE